jgi:hypothetical protein
MEIYIPTILNLTSDINIDSDVTKPSHQLPNYNYSINDFTSDFNIMYKEVLQCLQYKYDEKLSKFIFKLSNDTQTLISSINLINHYTTLSLNQNDRQNINKHDIVAYPNSVRAFTQSKLSLPNHFIYYLSSVFFNDPDNCKAFTNLKQIEEQIINGLVFDNSKKSLGEQLVEQLEPIANDNALKYIFEQLILKKRTVIKNEKIWTCFPFKYDDIIMFDVKIIGTINNNNNNNVEISNLNDFFKKNINDIAPYVENIKNCTIVYNLKPVIWRISLKIGKCQSIINIPHFKTTQNMNKFISNNHKFIFLYKAKKESLNEKEENIDELYKKLSQIINTFLYYDNNKKDIIIYKKYNINELISIIKTYCDVLSLSLRFLKNLNFEDFMFISCKRELFSNYVKDKIKHIMLLLTITSNICCNNVTKIESMIKVISYILYNLCNTFVLFFTDIEINELKLKTMISDMNRWLSNYNGITLHNIINIMNLFGCLFKNILNEKHDLNLDICNYSGYPNYIKLHERIENILLNYTVLYKNMNFYIFFEYFCSVNIDTISLLMSFFNLGNFDLIEVLMRIVNVENKLFTIKMLEYGGIICNDTIILTSQITNCLSVSNFYNIMLNSEIVTKAQHISKQLEYTIMDDIHSTEIKKCDDAINKLQIYNTILKLF